MAIAFDAISTGTGNHASPATFSHTVASSDNMFLVVFTFYISGFGGPFITDVTYNGVAMTLFDSSAVVTLSLFRFQAWILANPDVGTHNIVLTPDGDIGAGAALFQAGSYSGVSSISPEQSVWNQNTQSGGTSFTADLGTSTLQDNEWIVGHLYNFPNSGGPVTITATSGTDRIQGNNGSANVAFFDKGPITPPGNESVSGTTAAAQFFWGGYVYSLVPPAADFTPQVILI